MRIHRHRCCFTGKHFKSRWVTLSVSIHAPIRYRYLLLYLGTLCTNTTFGIHVHCTCIQCFVYMYIVQCTCIPRFVYMCIVHVYKIVHCTNCIRQNCCILLFVQNNNMFLLAFKLSDYVRLHSRGFYKLSYLQYFRLLRLFFQLLRLLDIIFIVNCNTSCVTYSTAIIVCKTLNIRPASLHCCNWGSYILDFIVSQEYCLYLTLGIWHQFGDFLNLACRHIVHCTT